VPKSSVNKFPVLFVELCNFEFLLQEAEALKFEKRILNLEQKEDSLLQRAKTSKYFKKIDFWLKAKPHLSDEIKEMEAFRKFELSKVEDFVPSTLDKTAFKG
jgi:hypothetical protein